MQSESSPTASREWDRRKEEPECGDPNWTDPHARGGESADESARTRLARLARAIEIDVIPRLVQAHRPANGAGAAADAAAGPVMTVVAGDLKVFLQSIVQEDEGLLDDTLNAIRGRGVLVESLYIDLFAPTARRLGEMWDDDLCDFSTVTVALGRLQRLLRDLSPAFGAEVDHPTNGRRALFVQPRDEQHSFGLSIVAEFFRRSGWDVMGGVGGAVADPASKVRDEWVDVIGFSIGSDMRLAWLTECIRAARGAARNAHMAVLVGGPPFMARPELVELVGADGTAQDAREAPRLAERLLARHSLHK